MPEAAADGAGQAPVGMSDLWKDLLQHVWCCVRAAHPPPTRPACQPSRLNLPLSHEPCSMATASWLDPTTRQARLWKKHDLLALPHAVHKLEVALLLPALRGQRVLSAALEPSRRRTRRLRAR